MGGFFVFTYQEDSMAKKIVPIDGKVRVVPANQYDTLEFAALAFGGIGGGDWFGFAGEDNDLLNGPICVNGLAVSAGIVPEKKKSVYGDYFIRNEPSEAVKGLTVQANDDAIDSLQLAGIGAEDAEGEWRVPFPAYCKALNIVRGA